jgi:ubiquinone/menaquinone biosynthesis C-methylase UbiE
MNNLSLLFLLFLLILLILTTLTDLTWYTFYNKKEHFDNPVKTLIVENMYDKFYAPVYSILVADQIQERTKYEIADLIKHTNLKNYQEPQLLDLGCGVGDHFQWLIKQSLNNIKLTGIDSSESMLKEARKRLGKQSEKVRLISRNIDDEDLFMNSSYSHITCYYFTLYELNIESLSQKIHNWLRPGGWFAVHMVDIHKFDPILDAASPFIGLNIQKYSKNRITDSKIHFKNFIYQANFKLKKKFAYFEESFHFKNKPLIRKQKRKLNRTDPNEFIDMMTKCKMDLKHTTHLIGLGYAFQYILYFQKV